MNKIAEHVVCHRQPFFDKNVDQHKVCKNYLETITGRELASRPSSFCDLRRGIKYFIAVNGYIVILPEVALSDLPSK